MEAFYTGMKVGLIIGILLFPSEIGEIVANIHKAYIVEMTK